MRATVLVDNNPFEELECEWGFSVLIQTDPRAVGDTGTVILLDTGASDMFALNAEKLGIDLSAVDFSALSHAHFDHSDGFDAFFRANDHAKLIIQEAVQENCYSNEGEHRADPEYIGIAKGMLARHGERLQRVSEIVEFAPGAWIVPHSTPGLEKVGERVSMQVLVDGEFAYDDFSHEQTLVIETPRGLAVFNSCSHSGIEPIMGEVRAAFPGVPVAAYVGGLHLYLHTPEQVREVAATIRSLDIKKVYTGHCTGIPAFDILKEELGDAVESFHSGFTFEV